MLRPLNSRFEFGDFRVDLASRAVYRGATRLPFNSRAFDTLVALLQQPGEVLEKDYLLRTVWADAIVEEKNLAVQIAAIRKALGEDPQAPSFIATIPGRGYQFIAPVRALNPDTVDDTPVDGDEDRDADPSVERASFSKQRIAGVAVLMVTIITVIVAWVVASRPTSSSAITSIAILPVRSLVSSEQDAYLEIGMADALITRLSRLRAVTVRPISAVRSYVAPDLDARTAGRQLQVDAIVDAHLQRQADRVRVTAQLIRVSDGASLWADSFDEPASHLFTLEDALSQRLAAALSLTLTGDARHNLEQPSSRNAVAYEAYLKGRFFWSRWTNDGLDRAVTEFRNAIAADPQYALAYAGLADAYVMQGYRRLRRPRDVFPQATDAARHALALDDGSADAHLVLAKTLFFYEWKFPEAEREMRRALSLDGDHGDAHGMYGTYLMAMGDFAGTFRERSRALQLDPLSALATNAMGWTEYYRHRPDEAIVWYQKALEIDPLFAASRNDIGEAHFLAGRTDMAIRTWLDARRPSSGQEHESRLRQQFEVSGVRGYWEEQLRDASVTSRSDEAAWRLARIHHELGHTDEMFVWLDRAYENRDSLMVFLKVLPIFERVRGDRRFKDLLDRIGLN